MRSMAAVSAAVSGADIAACRLTSLARASLRMVSRSSQPCGSAARVLNSALLAFASISWSATTKNIVVGRWTTATQETVASTSARARATTRLGVTAAPRPPSRVAGLAIAHVTRG